MINHLHFQLMRSPSKYVMDIVSLYPGDAGSYTWTVPVSGLVPADDYYVRSAAAHQVPIPSAFRGVTN